MLPPNPHAWGLSNFNSQYLKLLNNLGTVAWALIPLNVSSGAVALTDLPPDVNGWDRGPLTPTDLQGINLTMPGASAPLEGLIMVMGKDYLGFCQEAALRYASIGARHAVAMDASDSAMLGSGGELLPIYGGAHGSPTFGKQQIQKYGFYCD